MCNTFEIHRLCKPQEIDKDKQATLCILTRASKAIPIEATPAATPAKEPPPPEPPAEEEDVFQDKAFFGE